MVKYLLDTHVLIWFLTDNPKKLSKQTLAILNDETQALYFSTTSIWEMSIKHSLGKPDFEYDPQQVADELLRLGFEMLDIKLTHTIAVKDLPLIHNDPFDRLLIVQAEREKLTLLTADNHILQYQKPFVVDVRV